MLQMLANFFELHFLIILPRVFKSLARGIYLALNHFLLANFRLSCCHERIIVENNIQKLEFIEAIE